MLDKTNNQQRIFIAAIISFIFFAVYGYFFSPKYPVLDQNKTVKTVSQNNNNLVKEVNGDNVISKTVNIASNDSIIATIKSPHFEADIDRLGRINSFYLNDNKYKKNDLSRLNLVDHSLRPYPLEIRFSNTDLNKIASNVAYNADIKNINITDKPQTITLTQNLPNLTIKKIVTFYPLGNYDLKVELSKNEKYYITPGFRPNLNIDSYTIHGVIIRQKGGKLDILEDGDIKESKDIPNSVMAAAVDRYYTTLFYTDNSTMNAIVSKDDSNKDSVVFIKGEQNLNIKGYIGPKDHAVLDSINPILTDVIEYGWFTFIAKPMFALLSFLHGYIGNWGWTIVVMTILIRIVLFPLTFKGMVSMNKLKDLAPKVKDIQAKYKGDPQKMNAHMMELYKKNGANPMSGCLPILVQIPIFFAMYRVLLNAIELKGAPWIFWIHDLAEKDPYYVLPILMGATMFLQQHLTPNTITDPMQAKIMKYLPIIFTFFFITFPAGLTLYWVVNNICSIIQQLVVNKTFAMHKLKEIEQKKSKNI